MFTKKQLLIVVVLAIIAVTVPSVLDLPAGARTFFLLPFSSLGIYFIYQNNKDNEKES